MSFYAYFTDKGDITQISNVLDVNSTDMHINIDEEMFVAFSEERINYLNYKVISGKLVLKAEIELEKYTDSRIPLALTDKVVENSMIITQDKNNKQWVAQCYLSNDVLENFLLMPPEHIEKKIFTFYVISKDNRFILLDTIKIPAKFLFTKNEGWTTKAERSETGETVEVYTCRYRGSTKGLQSREITTQDVRLLVRRDFLTYHHNVVGEVV
tara:strand:+ start:225 stop:860 length:636 start_codon:yes stop_codon:yes gene_type:complete